MKPSQMKNLPHLKWSFHLKWKTVISNKKRSLQYDTSKRAQLFIIVPVFIHVILAKIHDKGGPAPTRTKVSFNLKGVWRFHTNFIGRLKRRTMSEVEEPGMFKFLKFNHSEHFHFCSVRLSTEIWWRLVKVLRSRGVGNGFLFRFTLEDVTAWSTNNSARYV